MSKGYENMTIVVLHHANGRVFAMADGLISRGDARVLEQDNKIVVFQPCYKIPKFSVGRFDYLGEYKSGAFAIAYAGKFSLTATIVKNFLHVVEACLYIDRDGRDGRPRIYKRSGDIHAHFRELRADDSYNFDSNELIPISVDLLATILDQIARKACADFARNAMSEPDAEFLVFGTERGSDYGDDSQAQVLKYVGWEDGDVVSERYSVLPWSIACIGDAGVIPGLVQSIEKDVEFANRPAQPEERKTHAEGDELELLWFEADDDPIFCRHRERAIKRHVLPWIERNIGTIGGHCTMVAIERGRPDMQTIAKEALQAAMQDLSSSS